MALEQVVTADRSTNLEEHRRALCIQRVVEAFEAAGAEYVMLHTDGRSSRDSRLDISVARQSLLAFSLLDSETS